MAEANGNAIELSRHQYQRDWWARVAFFAATVVTVFGAWVALNNAVATLSEKVSNVQGQIHDVVTRVDGLATLSVSGAALTAEVRRDQQDIADLRTTAITNNAALGAINTQLGILSEQVRVFTLESSKGRSR